MGVTLKVTAKGRVTLRKELLDHLGVEPGGKIVVDVLPWGRAEVRAARPRATIDDFIGCLKQPGGPSITLDEINRIATNSWAGKR